MADTKLADLTALTAPSGDDLLYVVDDPAGTPADRKLALNNLFTRGTVTADSPIIDAAQTWNNAAVTFTSLKLNVTDTASNASSLLMDLQTGGTSRFSVSKAGTITLGTAALNTAPNNYSNVGIVVAGGGGIFGYGGGLGIFSSSGTKFFYASDGGAPDRRFTLLNSTFIGFRSDGSTVPPELILRQRAAANLQLGNTDTGAVTATVTITIAAPGVVTWNNHTLSAGTPVVFTTTGALPTGITAGTTYYAVPVDANTFQIATSVANAIAATPTVITTSGSQSGTHTGTRYAISQRLTPQGVTGVTNIAGSDFFIQGSQGTGTGAGGSIVFQVAPAGSTGSAQNALATAATLKGDGIWDISGSTANGFRIDNGGVLLLYANTSNLVQIGGNGLVPRTDGGSALGSAPTGGFSGGWSNLYLHTNAAVRFNNDTILARDAANTLALRNGANAQTFRVYNTYTDASNYSFGSITYETPSNGITSLTINSNNAAGSGTAQQLWLKAQNNIYLGGSAGYVWTINNVGHFLAGADNTYDIGASGATRPRSVYVGSSVIAGGTIKSGASSYFQFNTRTAMSSPSDGVLLLQNDATTDFNRVQFGGTTSSFPALKRSSASIVVRLADDSANAALESASVKTDAPAGGTSGTWKLGVAATVSPTSPNRTIEVDIGGTIYYIHAKTTND